MLAHRSIRSYTDRTVSDEDLNSIIRAVQAAPNWVNLQLVSIIAVKNTDHRRRLAELCGNQVHIAETVVQITDQISDENGTADPRRALQLPADVIAAGLTPNPRK